MNKKIVFWGATGQAKVLYECIAGSGMELVALFDNNKQLESPFPEVPLFFGESEFMSWHSLHQDEKIYFLAAIGGSNGKDRMKIQTWLQQQGLSPYTARHNTAFLAQGVTIGSGSQILARSVIGVQTQVGRACIVNTAAIIDHECVIGDGVHICPGAVLAGCVEVGRYATIGTGAIILPRAVIHEGAVVGAGAVVTKNIPAYTVAAGNPARILRSL